jgi:hypothetical protein
VGYSAPGERKERKKFFAFDHLGARATDERPLEHTVVCRLTPVLGRVPSTRLRFAIKYDEGVVA